MIQALLLEESRGLQPRFIQKSLRSSEWSQPVQLKTRTLTASHLTASASPFSQQEVEGIGWLTSLISLSRHSPPLKKQGVQRMGRKSLWTQLLVAQLSSIRTLSRGDSDYYQGLLH